MPIRNFKSRFGLLILCAAVVSITGLGFAAFKIVSRPASFGRNGGLVVDSADLNFGDAPEQKEFSHTLYVKNPTNYPVQVAKLFSGCICTSVQPQSFTVEPGEKQAVRLTLDLRSHDSQHAASAETGRPREFSVGLFPQISSPLPAPTEEWRVVGQVRKSLVLERQIIDFGDISILDDQTHAQTVSVRCLESIDSFAATCEAKDGRVEVLQGTDSRSKSLQFTLAKGLRLSRFDFEIHLTPKGLGGEALPQLPIRVTGRMVNDVQVFPSEVTLGAVRIGGSEDESVELRSLTGRPFVVQSTQVADGAPTIQTLQDPIEPTKYRVIVRPSQSGVNSSDVNFHVVSGEASAIVPLRISYVGLESAGSVSQRSAPAVHDQQGS